MKNFEKINPREYLGAKTGGEDVKEDPYAYEEGDLIENNGYKDGEDPNQEYDLDLAKKAADEILAEKSLAAALDKQEAKEAAEAEERRQNIKEDEEENKRNFIRF